MNVSEVVEMFEAIIKETPPATVAYLPMQGAYDQIPDGYRRLYEWIGRHRLQPVAPPAAVYLTMPDATRVGETLFELWAPVAQGPAAAEPDDEHIGVKLIGQETVASTLHRGPYDSVASAYEQLGRWIAENGHTVVGPPREIYMSEPDVPPQEVLTEIQFPVLREG